ncbi:MAG: YihY/virulence factor BrkB family protein, partial [Candidatus Aminicenantes bacterium]|nr:YihY/virulence factor BrkB family protein [Candidatus Aminicenantes bacterium]
MSIAVFDVLRDTFKRFNDDRCWNAAIVISYFAFLCSVPVVALFVFVTTKIVGSSELALRSLNLFSDEFFAHLDPSYFAKLRGVSENLSNLGWFGLIGSLVSASFLFSNLIYSINIIFRANYQRSFVYNRLIEYTIMFTMGIVMLISLSITAIWTGMHRALQESSFVAAHINPNLIAIVNNFFVQYLLPLALTFFVFFIFYKFIPETKVHTGAAALGAAVGAVLWEAFKRIFAFYVANLSAIGIVLSKLLQGTLTSII